MIGHAMLQCCMGGGGGGEQVIEHINMKPQLPSKVEFFCCYREGMKECGGGLTTSSMMTIGINPLCHVA